MKYSLILIMFISGSVWGQKDTVLLPVPVYVDTVNKIISLRKTKTSKVYYGLAGIQKPPFDSAKYYFHKFLYFNDRMSKTTGKTFTRMEDSATFYYKKLYPKK